MLDTPLAEHNDAPTAERPAEVPVRRRREGVRRVLAALAGYLVLQGLVLAALGRVAPRFFYYDDSLAQFLPMMWWLGRNAEGGVPPLMDPEQGMAGNFLVDMQYGALDPLHWLLQGLAARTDDLLLVSFVYGAVSVTLLGLGSLTVLMSHRVPVVLAVAGAVGTASSGFFLWYGSSWWPLLWSVAWLPWFWFGLTGRGSLGILAVGVASWALLTSGNPYVLFFVVVLVVGHLVERRLRAGTWRDVVDGALVLRLVSAVGGCVVAVPTLLATVELSGVMGRPEGDALIGNVGFAVANLADVVLGGPTLMGQTNFWSGNIGLVPAMATMLLALPAVALVDWRRALRVPGVVPAGLVYLSAVVATQLPTVVAVFRYPLRYVVVAEVFLPALVLIALSAAPRLTRGRVQVALGIVLAQFVLALFRAPVFYKWHVLAAVLTAAGLAVLLVHLRARGSSRAHRLSGVAVALAVTLGPVVSLHMMAAVQERVDAVEGTASGGQPFRALTNAYWVGTSTDDYEARSVATDAAATVVTFAVDPDWGWSSGVLVGNANLPAGFRPGFGALAVWHEDLNERWCRTYQGATCSEPAQLLAPAGDTDVPWIDLLSSDVVLLSDNAPEEIREHFDQTWREVGAEDPWTEYRRDDDLPGRVTAVDGVTVSPEEWSSGLARVDRPMDAYTVSTGEEASSLTTRIPYYPGMTATVDGRPLPVSSVEGAVLAVELPAGLEEARLELSYAPASARAVVPATVAGTAVMVLAAVGGLVLRRRAGR
ncbi:YfhO family protein [Geodermatophilus poikilotrophus]|uniref:Membrane protein YfhO n=1 Tax=Geodermatophilus poikilotrophus TaxID=1333667 RepID=A0A1I0H514_9ACTN|nr:YfhO family protein [Geodermatophilus poikilotrophus]SET77928.1 membrane protein YfhO [Geodermatophilus poikilotrophus]